MLKFLGTSALILALGCAPVAAQEANGCVDIDKNHGSLVDVPFVPTGTPLLSRFGFALNQGDNHIKQVAIHEDNGQLTVSFHDQQFSAPDDTFLWSVQYAYVPGDRFSQVGELSGTRAHDRVIATIPTGKAVLRGFSFTYQPYFTSGNDHHLQQIGVRPNTTGSAFLTYRDDNGDDGFDWDYRWAIIKTFGVMPGDLAAASVAVERR